MSKKKVEVDLEVKSNLEPSIQRLKDLKKELRGLSVGSDEFKKVTAEIRDTEDALNGAKQGADDFMGSLENASGPLGVAARGLKTLETSFSTFNGALKASVIGILVATLGGLVAAFRSNEEAMKKLEPIMIGVEKILGGIFRAAEPLLDIFVDLAMNALPYVTDAIGGVYSAFSALFTYVKEVGTGYAKLVKGIFTLDTSSITEGIDQMKGSFGKAYDAASETYDKFQEGTKEVTKTEKENEEERKKLREEAEAKRKEQAQKVLEARKKEFDALITLETNKENTSREKLKTLLDKRLSLELQQADLTEAEKKVIRDKYAKQLTDTLKEDEDKRKEEREKALNTLSAELDAKIILETDKQNTSNQNLKTLLDERMMIELEQTERSEAEKEVIRQKYAKQLKDALDNDTKEVETKRQETLDKDLLFLETKYGEFAIFDENYYADLRNLYDENEKGLKEALDKGAINQKEYDNKLAQSSKARRELDKLERLSAVEKVGLISDALGQLSSLVGEQTSAGKAFAIAQTTIDTYQSATAAYAALAGIPVIGPALGAIAAAAAVAGGIANVRKITSVQLPGGGDAGNSGTGSSVSPSPGGSGRVVSVNASPVRRAQGGIIRGSGGDFSDSIPALLSNGEFVINSRSTRMFQPLLSSINEMGNLPKFAAGGMVNSGSMNPQQNNDNRIVEMLGDTLSQVPIRTFVSSSDISNTQQMDRMIKSRSLI